MKIDNAVIGNTIENLVPVTGSTFPSAQMGELFYLSGHATLPNGLYFYEEGSWAQIAAVGGLPPGYRVIPGALANAKAAGNTAPVWAPIAGSINAWQFEPTKMNELSLSYLLPRDLAVTSGLFASMQWLPTTTAAGTVRLGFEYIYADSHGLGIFPVTSATVYLEQASTQVLGTHQLISTLTEFIAGATATPDGVILARVFRDAPHANDTYPDDIFILQANCLYLADKLGTSTKVPPFS